MRDPAEARIRDDVVMYDVSMRSAKDPMNGWTIAYDQKYVVLNIPRSETDTFNDSDIDSMRTPTQFLS